MTPAFLEALEQQPWKGNIRELRNVIERSLIVCEGGRLDICDLPLEIQNTHYECSDDSVGSFELAAMERRHIARVLEYTLRIIQRELHKYAEMVMDENMSVIHIIGSLHWERTQVESHIMDTIKDIPVSLISYGGSDHCFTLSVHTTDKNRLISSLSRQFFESQCAA